MYYRTLSLALIFVLPIIASFVVFAMANVTKTIWILQIVATCLAALLATAGTKLLRLPRHEFIVLTVSLLTLLSLAITLIHGDSAPRRWLNLGIFNLYAAPVFLPSFIVVCSVALQSKKRLVLLALIIASSLLAAQPDASQVLALSIGTAIMLLRSKSYEIQKGMVLIVLAGAVAWAFMQPDHLEPIPYVEGVFELVINKSLILGISVVASAFVLVVGLCWQTQYGQPWLWSVAAYYLVLYVCSIAGLTPAPLIGYGAGPILGFGVMVAVSYTLKTDKVT
jgi:hypothetical protein